MISMMKGILLIFVLIWDYIFLHNLKYGDNYFYVDTVIIQIVALAAVLTIITC